MVFLPDLLCLATSSSKRTERRRFSGFAGTGPAVEIPDAAAAVVASLRRVSAREMHCVRGWEWPLFAARSLRKRRWPRNCEVWIS